MSADKRIGLPAIRGEGDSEHYTQRRISAEMLMLALKHDLITDEHAAVLIHDLDRARNAREILLVQDPIRRILYREAIDYSSILHFHGVLSDAKCRELRSLIARGKEFTLGDQKDTDHLITLAAWTTAGKGDAQEISRQVQSTLRRIELRKQAFPVKRKK